MNTVVIGDGWSALAAVGFLAQQAVAQVAQGAGKKPSITWITGMGARVLSAHPGLDGAEDAHEGVALWQRLARGFGMEIGEAGYGSFLREFRNKAFREPAWNKAPTPEDRLEVLKENLWGPECGLTPLWECRFERSLNEIEQEIRTKLIGDAEDSASWRSQIRRIGGLPVTQFNTQQGKIQSVVLASGEEIACDRVIYADRWNMLPTVQGLPKNLPFIRRRDPAGVLQATFTHATPMGVGVQEGFFGTLHKEAGEQMERHMFGHFSSDGMQSYWTLCLVGDEVEDNHQIAKKLRRMKNGLDKMFTGESWLPAEKPEFMANVSAEQVRFQEGVVFAEGEAPQEPVTLAQFEGVFFVTDGYGPSSALRQVGLALGLAPETAPRTDTQAEGMHGESPEAS